MRTTKRTGLVLAALAIVALLVPVAHGAGLGPKADKAAKGQDTAKKVDVIVQFHRGAPAEERSNASASTPST